MDIPFLFVNQSDDKKETSLFIEHVYVYAYAYTVKVRKKKTKANYFISKCEWITMHTEHKNSTVANDILCIETRLSSNAHYAFTECNEMWRCDQCDCDCDWTKKKWGWFGNGRWTEIALENRMHHFEGCKWLC